MAAMWMVPMAFLGGATAAAAIGSINSLINAGGFAAPYLIGWTRDIFSLMARSVFPADLPGHHDDELIALASEHVWRGSFNPRTHSP